MAAPHSLPTFAPAAGVVPSEELSARKAALRARARIVRAGLDPAAAGAAVASRVLAEAPARGTVVAGFWPMRDEIDLRPLWRGLHAAGCRVVLPETRARGEALVFHAWAPGMAMVAERFGTQRPVGPLPVAGPEAGQARAPEPVPGIVPQLIYVPFLASDRACHRLGYGGGYYDRTLASLPGVAAVGLGFSALAVDSLPVGPHDRALDAVITELGVTVPTHPEG